MDEIFSMMEDAKRFIYDKNYIEELYIKYLATEEVQCAHLAELKSEIQGKEILVIAPGRSSISEKDKVIKCANRETVVVISINFEYTECETDYIFLSNLRRYRELDSNKCRKCIVTSNIPSSDVYLQTQYKELLNTYESVEDNAGMMLIKYLIKLGAEKILIAGLDGYSIDPTQNFADNKMNFYAQKATFEAMNRGLNAAVADFSKEIDIEYVTTPKYITVL